jgi:hypothetical protein
MAGVRHFYGTDWYRIRPNLECYYSYVTFPVLVIMGPRIWSFLQRWRLIQDKLPSNSFYKCCGSICFWASRIRIPIRLSQVRIRTQLRILLSFSKNSYKTLIYTALWLLYGFLSLENDVNIPVFRIRRIRAGLWIRIHFLRIRIRIQWIRMEANTDPDTDPDPIRIQGFNDQKLKKNNSWKKN